MKLIDMHCDTVWKLMDIEQKGDLFENQCSVNIPAMKLGGSIAQFFACFGYLDDFKEKGGYDGCYQHVLNMITYLRGQVEKYPDILAPAASRKEIEANEGEGKISVVTTVEEGGVLNGDLSRLKELKDRGISLITLMWNYENCIGFPNSRDVSVMWQGLKPFGIEVVSRMGELGMIVDVSHASDGTFRDIMEYAKGPVVASHSNCREILNHPRNLSDEMIRKLANAGGVAGLNFYGAFLGSKTESKIEEMKAHVLHMIKVGGSDFPAIGTDFDGFDGIDVLEVPDIGQMEKLWTELKKSGVSESQLDKIWSGNVLRVMGYI